MWGFSDIGERFQISKYNERIVFSGTIIEYYIKILKNICSYRAIILVRSVTSGIVFMLNTMFIETNVFSFFVKVITSLPVTDKN